MLRPGGPMYILYINRCFSTPPSYLCFVVHYGLHSSSSFYPPSPYSSCLPRPEVQALMVRRWKPRYPSTYYHVGGGPVSARLAGSMAYSSARWRHAAHRYAGHLAKFAVRGAGNVGLAVGAAALAYHGYKAYKAHRKELKMPSFAQTKRGRERERQRPYHADRGTMVNYAYKRPRRSSGAGGVNPSVMTMSRMATGKFKSFSRKMNSLMKASLVPYVDQFGLLTTTYDASGTYPLTYTTADAGVTYAYPVWLYDLNTNPRSGTTLTGCPLMRLVRTAATGAYSFSAQSSQNNDINASTFAPQVIYEGDTINQNQSIAPNVYLDWTDIRMSINGPKKTASRVTVKLVRFIDDSCQPPCYTTLAATPSTAPTIGLGRDQPTSGDDLNDWNGLWQEYLAHLLGNPLAVRSKPVGRKMQVLRTFTHQFQPRSTTEDSITGGVGDMKLLKWFNRVGKTYYFGRTLDPTDVTAAEEINPGETNVQVSSAMIDTHARPRARLFLMIDGYTPVIADGTTDKAATDVACSFDLLVRRKFYMTDHL